MQNVLKSKKVQLFIIICLTILSYSNSLWGGFVWDDQFFIQDWTAIRDVKNLPLMLQGGLPPRFSGAYRPILSLSYLVSYQLWGQNPVGYHLQALLVHLVCTILVYLIVSELFQKVSKGKKVSKVSNGSPFGTLPFLVALLFGLHPIHTEAVSYIAASFNTIGVMFMLGAFYLYLRANSLWRIAYSKKPNHKPFAISYMLSFVSALLAFFTYEFTLVLPLLLLWQELTLGKLGRLGKLGIVKRLVPYFIGVGIYIFMRTSHIHTVGRGGYAAGSFYLTMLAMSRVFVRYLQLLIWPIHQSINHMLPGGFLAGVYLDPKVEAIQKQSFFPWFPITIIIFITIITIIWKCRKKAPLISFALGWYLISLLPASNIIPVQELMAERYLYIPSVGFLLFLVLFINYLVGFIVGRVKNSKLKVQNYNSKLKINNLQLQLLTLNFVLLTVLYSYLTFQRNNVWKDNFSLWKNTAEQSPISEIALFNLGNAYVKRGDLDNAIKSYKQASDNNPRSQVAYINLGNAYFQKKRYEEALSSYKKAVEILPYTPANHNNLASVYVILGQNELAARHYVIAILLDPNHQTAKNNLQILVSEHKDLDIQKIISTINLNDRQSLVE